MIDRSYLPFESARNYQDRKMAKWMGFFLSEHSTAIKKNSKHYYFPNRMSNEEMFLRINQAYTNDLEIKILIEQKDRLHHYTGKIGILDQNNLWLKTNNSYQKINFQDILTILEV